MNVESISCLWFILSSFNMVKCNIFMDIISNFAFNGIRCLVLISEENHAIDTTNVSNISVSLYGTNTNLPALSASGRYCLYILLIFNSVESSIQFLNR